MAGSAHNPFALRHPAVAFTYLVCAAAFAMAVPHPVYAALSLAGAAACGCCTCGARACARKVGPLAGVIALVAVTNLIFVGEGSTVLLRVGERALTLESLEYGLCAGTMLAAVFLWFTSYAACMDSSATEALLGRAAPTVSLMVSQVMRLVPQFARRGRAIMGASAATTSAAPAGTRERASGHLRTVTVLMGWGLEDGVARADAMRCRGYGCGRKRTSYRRYRLSGGDAALIACVLALSAANAALAAIALAQFSFYPTPPRLLAWWGYLPYLALMMFAPALFAREAVLWHR